MAADFRSILRQVRQEVPEIDANTLHEQMGKNDDLILVDVREGEEFRQGHIGGAEHCARGFLEMKIGDTCHNTAGNIVLYWQSGIRSLLAARTLKEMGYENVASLAGGFRAWQQGGYSIDAPRTLDEQQMMRYSRHLTLPQVGLDGQMKLLNSRVLLIGAGGLGSPSAFYLAAAGIGTLGIIDDDVVDESNLQRQIAHTTYRVGINKAESARDSLKALNPSIEIIPYPFRLKHQQIMDVFADYDVVVDGTDNFTTRYLVNDACFWAKKPLVCAAIQQFEGQATVIKPGDSACYRCIFPTPPPPDMVPSWQEAGVLGVLPGVIGCIQATEVIKLILGTGNSLMGRLMLYDALEMRFREVKVSRDPECALCGENPSITDFIDYDHFAETGETRPHSDGEKTKESRSVPRPSPRSNQTMSTNGDSCSTPDCSWDGLK